MPPIKLEACSIFSLWRKIPLVWRKKPRLSDSILIKLLKINVLPTTLFNHTNK